MLPGEDAAAIVRTVREGLADLERKGLVRGGGVRMIKEGVPFETTASSPLVRRLQDACADLKVGGRAEGAGWYSDAGPFSRTCGQVAVFGPGSILQAHTEDEFIDLDQLRLGRDILAGFLRRLASEAAAGAAG